MVFLITLLKFPYKINHALIKEIITKINFHIVFRTSSTAIFVCTYITLAGIFMILFVKFKQWYNCVFLVEDNQPAGGVPNKVGNTRDKLYHNVLQDWLSWDQEVPGQWKSELFTSFRRPGFQPKVNNWIIEGNERRVNNCIIWRDYYVPIHWTRNNQKSGEMYRIN